MTYSPVQQKRAIALSLIAFVHDKVIYFRCKAAYAPNNYIVIHKQKDTMLFIPELTDIGVKVIGLNIQSFSHFVKAFIVDLLILRIKLIAEWDKFNTVC